MNRFDHNKVIRGSFGKVWLNDERLANIKSFEAKAAMNYEDMDVNGSLGTQKRYMGYTITGTMTLYKFDSTVLRLMKDGIKTGVMPEIKIVTALDDPTAYGAERVVLTDVTLDEVTLSKFENKGLTEEEVPFAAGNCEFPDLI